MRGPRLTAAIAALALTVGSLSAVGGVLQERAADRKVCDAKVAVNASVRGLIDDFIVANPKVTKAERVAADRLAVKRFPDHC